LPVPQPDQRRPRGGGDGDREDEEPLPSRDDPAATLPFENPVAGVFADVPTDERLEGGFRDATPGVEAGETASAAPVADAFGLAEPADADAGLFGEREGGLFGGPP
jgi:hypothetical protein